MNGGWLGVFIAPTTKGAVGGGCCHMAHRIVRCASHITRPLEFDRWSFCLLGHRTVRWCTGQVLFTVRCAFCACSDFCAHCSALTALSDKRWRCVAVAPLAHRTVRCYTGQSGATPDSPVNYSGAAPRIPEGGKFGVEFPGAPDTFRWHTGQSGAPDEGTLRLSFALFI
jgi:hypothetical protein